MQYSGSDMHERSSVRCGVITALALAALYGAMAGIWILGETGIETGSGAAGVSAPADLPGGHGQQADGRDVASLPRG